ncbi:ATP-binding protein [Aureimonas sp. AU20]|uniref:ATP-binding protein n=1 Tax=Aureimonas sp. AU20 TaxID=1349819 RepID=UPI001651440E|nr:ATP-binding protein [Aureimonas sp. AU20]
MSPDDRLAAEVARMLLPQRFPHRRDLELSGLAGTSAEACSFYDVFWPPGGLLALCAASVPRAGASGALRAAALQKLVRAGLGLSLSADETLALVGRAYAAEFEEEPFDLALLTLDPASGRFAGAGQGRHIAAIGARVSPGDGVLPIGSVLWLAAGAQALGEPAGEGPDLGLDDLAARLLDTMAPGVALVGVTLRATGRKASYDFSMANELAAIAGLVSGVEATLAREGVPEPVAAGLGLALDELLTNTVSYGYLDGGWHEILVELDVAPGCVDVSVRDDGRAFDPLLAPEPDLAVELEERQVGGLGIHFVRTLADEISYERERGWNVLRLRKRFDPEAGLESSGG